MECHLVSADKVEMTIWLHLSRLSCGELSLEGHFNVRSISSMSVTKVVSHLSVSRNL